MSIFSAEIATLVSAAAKITGTDIYGVPWYLVLGEPRTGKSTVVRSMNLTWQGDGKIPMPPTAINSYYVAKEAVFIEAGDRICGPNKNADFLRELCEELKKVRAREPLDAMLLIIGASDVAELTEQSLEPYAQMLRNYPVEVCKTIGADIPVYCIANRYDTLWGFAEVFQWNADRAKEEAWGFVVPPETPSQNAIPKIEEGIVALTARIEAFCLARLSSEDGVEQRMRAFQHLSESKQFLEKLRDVLKIVAFANRYERAPWVRALIVGAAVPGVGDRIRASIARFNNMGIIQNPYDQARATRPGGLPVFSFMRTTVLPEKDLVPLRIRWRDDKLTVIGMIFGILCLIAANVLYWAVWR